MNTHETQSISRRGFARGLAVCGAAALLMLAAARPASAMEADDPAAFVRDFSDRAIAVLADKSLTEDRRRQAFRGLLIEGFDVGIIGRFVLGRYWRTTTEAERAEYAQLFESLIVATYSRQLASYGGETMKVEGVRKQDEKSAAVRSRILSQGGEPVLVEWRLLRRGGTWRIVDLVVEGMSMALSQRSEYTAVIRGSGGRVEGLLEKLREKTARFQHGDVQRADNTR